MPEERLRLASISVLGGSLHGHRYDPDEVVGEVLIGSDPDCHLALDLPAVSPVHARLWTDLDAITVRDTSAPRGVYVNTERVQGEATLCPGDVLWLGPPQESGSVCIQCRFEPWVETLPASPVAATGEAILPEEQAGEPAPAEVYEAVVLEDEPGPAPATSVPRGSSDPFFVGEADPAVAVPEAAAGLFTLEEASDVPSPKPPPTPAPDEPGPAPVGEDEWAIADAAPPAVVESVPAPEASDEFFVSEEPVPPTEPTEPLAPVELLPTWEVPGPPPAVETPPAPDFEPFETTPTPAPPVTSPEDVSVGPSPPASTISPAPPPEPAAVTAPAPTRPAAALAPRPAAAARPAARRPAARPTARRTSAGPSPWLRPLGLGLGGLALLGALGLGAWRLLGSAGVRVDAIEPARVRAGQRATIAGRGFATEAAGNAVSFGPARARVLSATAARLEVEVPDTPIESGSERRVDLVVRARGRASAPFAVTVIQGPRLHGLSPQAALPGEEVVLAGAGWGLGATVRFGGVPAQVLSADATSIRAIVPEAAGGPGTSAPVVVAVGGVDSNAAPFVIGRLPVVTAVEPRAASPGDVVTLSGLGFQANPLLNDVRVSGTPSLVVSATGESLKLVVPLVPAGDPGHTIELRVPDQAGVGQAALEVAAAADPVELRFVAVPFTAVPGRPHAVVATAVGPTLVLAASGGRSAADRALEVAAKLNAALPRLRTTAGLNFEARGYDTSPSIGLAGETEAALVATEEDALAYDEDWSGLRGRGGPVTRPRLARWWEAVLRDLVLLTVRGERPRHAADLAPEGRALVQLFEVARRSGQAGVPRRAVDEAAAPLREGLRLLALRVPATVAAPAAAGGPAPGATAAPPVARLVLEGTFRGSEDEEGQRRYLTVEFRGAGGTISYEGGITFTVPLQDVQRGRDRVRFSVPMRGAMRHYSGRWDGEKITGPISSDAAGRNVVATFELRPR
jgi:hypothetical protein